MLKNGKTEKVMWMLKTLLASYIVTGLLLLVLSFMAYKMKMDEQTVVAGLVIIYIISTFIGGFIIGKLTKTRKFVWGMLVGTLYCTLLFLISYGVYRDVNTNGLNILTTVLLCVGGGTLGGMLA